MGKATKAAREFAEWVEGSDDGPPMAEVLAQLQVALDAMAAQIDATTQRIDKDDRERRDAMSRIF